MRSSESLYIYANDNFDHDGKPDTVILRMYCKNRVQNMVLNLIKTKMLQC